MQANFSAKWQNSERSVAGLSAIAEIYQTVVQTDGLTKIAKSI